MPRTIPPGIDHHADTNVADWPRVFAEDWCGEFEFEEKS
jgi:hypothetical protein